ncbi:MAG: hypothetical protein AB7V13_16980 [Pseudorhodoplanes sp.]|uniref:hypothetical protein n=1 Tax=Pseudorhodoplanes sp. TaxID=1934341 RepID=UPI003D14FA9D
MSTKGHYLGGHTTFRVGDRSWGKVDKRPREDRAYPPPRSAAEEREFERFKERVKNPPAEYVLIKREDVRPKRKKRVEQLLEASNSGGKRKNKKVGKATKEAEQRSAKRLLEKRARIKGG